MSAMKNGSYNEDTGCSYVFLLFSCETKRGSFILLIAEILHQLRLVVYATNRGGYTSQ